LWENPDSIEVGSGSPRGIAARGDQQLRRLLVCERAALRGNPYIVWFKVLVD
jgi:hypothetical protein